MKLRLFFCTAALGLMAGTAHAVPVQVSGSSLNVDFDWGGGFVNYSANSMSSAVDLAVNDSFTFNFGTITVPLSFGEGTANFSVNFDTPTPDDSVTDEGSFSVFSVIFFSVGKLTWGDPVIFGYSHGNATGGLLQLDMHDIHGLQLGKKTDLTGTITNLQDPTAVPEPGILTLLGGGLLMLAAVRRRRTDA